MKIYRFALLTIVSVSFLSFSLSIVVLAATTEQIIEEEYGTNSYEDETTIAGFDSRLPWKKIIGKAFVETIVAYNLVLAGRFAISQLFLNFVMPYKNDFAQIPLKEFLSLPKIAAILPFKCFFNSKDKCIKTIVSSFETHKIQGRHGVWSTCRGIDGDTFTQIVESDVPMRVDTNYNYFEYLDIFPQLSKEEENSFLKEALKRLHKRDSMYPLSSGLRTTLIKKYTENSFAVFCAIFITFISYEYYQARKELANTL